MFKKSKIASLAVSLVLAAAGLVASTPSAEAVIVGFSWAGGSCPSSKYYYSVAVVSASGGSHSAQFGQTHIGDTRWQTWRYVSSTAEKMYWGYGWYVVDTNHVALNANSGSVTNKTSKCS